MRVSLFCLSLLLMTGCGASFEAATPPGFVPLDQEGSVYDYRATTADGLVLAVRQLEHDPQADLEFWVQAIKNEMKSRGGYAHLGTRPVANRHGLTGRQLRFGHDEGSQPHLYFLTLFLTEDHIYLVEAGGSKQLLEKHAAQIDWALANFQER